MKQIILFLLVILFVTACAPTQGSISWLNKDITAQSKAFLDSIPLGTHLRVEMDPVENFYKYTWKAYTDPCTNKNIPSIHEGEISGVAICTELSPELKYYSWAFYNVNETGFWVSLPVLCKTHLYKKTYHATIKMVYPDNKIPGIKCLVED